MHLRLVALRSLFPGIVLLMLAMGHALLLQAQLCTGSLGDPVVNITFGAGGTAGYTPSNAYTYTNSSCPDDGYYTITSSTSGCFGNSWHTVSSDHTGNGAFFLVNASFTPGDFFITKVSGLCPNTTYEFAAWIVNVLSRPGIKPNISFSIESNTGTVLKKFTTGDIPETPSAEWKQYGFFFVTPPTDTEIVLRMTNNAPGGNGNDIGLDDITFRPCGPIITTSIQGFSDTVHICEGQTNAYTFTSNVSAGYSSPVYQWQKSLDSGRTWVDIPGALTATYQRPSSGAGKYLYRLTITDQNAAGILACRIASNQLFINVHPYPLVNAGPDRTLFIGETITIQGNVTGEQPAYYWSPPQYLNDPQLLNPIAKPPQDQGYTFWMQCKR
jgi:hypothetical protein